MSSSDKDQLITALYDLAWSQWTELGVPGYTRRHSDVLIDPEALILFTAVLASSDKRLGDESQNWCIRDGACISVSRLKNLLKTGLGDEASFGVFASKINDASSLRWPVKNKSESSIPTQKSANTDQSASSSALARPADPVDPASPATRPDGSVIGPARPGGSVIGPARSVIGPDLERPALLRLKLRAIFGVGTRADILTELLYTPGKSAAELARIGYSKRQVANTVDDLTRGGLLRRTREGNTHRFELYRPDILDSIAGPLPGHNSKWVDCFRVLLSVLRLIEQHESKPPNMRSLAARRSMETVSDSLDRLRWQTPRTEQASEVWPTIIKWGLARAKHAAAGALGSERTQSSAGDPF